MNDCKFVGVNFVDQVCFPWKIEMVYVDFDWGSVALFSVCFVLSSASGVNN